MGNTISQLNNEKRQKLGAIVLGMGRVDTEMLMALAGMHHHDIPLIVVGQEQDNNDFGSIEELVAMKAKETQELIMTLQNIPHEEIILPVTKPINKNYNLSSHTGSSVYTSKPRHNNPRSFYKRKK